MMSENPSFFDKPEQAAIDQFLHQGTYDFTIAHQDFLKKLRQMLYQWSMAILELAGPPDQETFFDHTHRYVKPDDLNDFRLALIQRLTQAKDLKAMLYRMACPPLHWLAGNELAMQRALNLSIQLPNDDSSLLPLHSDVWSGNSPYELVFWLPLVDCYATKSMYVLPRHRSDQVLAQFQDYATLSAEAFFRKLEADLTWMEVPLGNALLFTHSVIHGNRVNREPTTRWSMNVRFKSLFSPYGSKELGESFLPITIRPATRVGFAYKDPEL